MISKILNNLKLFFEVFLSVTIASLIGLLATEEAYFYVYRVALIISMILTVIITVALFYKDRIDAYLWSQDMQGYLQFPRIGILYDEKIDKHFSKVEIEEWSSYFEEEKFIVEKITKEEIHLKYAVILNPYGETYPEEDLFHLKTLTDIRRYINQGGIFVNIAGIPFYYGYDSLSEKNVPLANEIYTYVPLPGKPEELIQSPKYPPSYSLLETVVNQHFKVFTTGGDWEINHCHQQERDKLFVGEIRLNGDSERIYQFRAVRIPTRKYVPFLRATSSYGEVYPIAGIPYGRGCLMACGFNFNVAENDPRWDETIHNSGFEKVCWAIMNLIRNRKNGKIPLNAEEW